jgi:hypothetical protein
MATTIRKLTGVGGDIRKIARLLQKKAPEGHMLAYITPEEAEVLKARGGSGKPEPDTGIPSFEYDDYYSGEFEAQQYQQANPAPQSRPPVFYSSLGGSEVTLPNGDVSLQQAQRLPEVSAEQPSTNMYTGPVNAGQTIPYTPSSGRVSYGDSTSTPFSNVGAIDTSTYAPTIVSRPESAFPAREIPLAGGGTRTPTEVETFGQDTRPFYERAIDKFTEGTSGKEMRDLALRGGLGLTQGLIGAATARKAAAQGQQAKKEIQDIGRPYQEKGKALQEQAQRGELTPMAQQSLQAAQAQAAQNVQGRGGVGVAQAQQQIEAFRQQLIAQQYDLGLKIAGIGDQYMSGAIKTGMQADQYVNQLTNNYYTNISRTVGGMPPSGAPA